MQLLVLTVLMAFFKPTMDSTAVAIASEENKHYDLREHSENTTSFGGAPRFCICLPGGWGREHPYFTKYYLSKNKRTKSHSTHIEDFFFIWYGGTKILSITGKMSSC